MACTQEIFPLEKKWFVLLDFLLLRKERIRVSSRMVGPTVKQEEVTEVDCNHTEPPSTRRRAHTQLAAQPSMNVHVQVQVQKIESLNFLWKCMMV